MNLTPKTWRFDKIEYMDFFHATVQTDIGPTKYLRIHRCDG